MNRLAPILQRMTPISLEEIQTVKLMNRIDSKYLLNKEQLELLMPHAEHDFLVQTINGQQLAPYKTLYFDTENVAMYTMHHNRKLNRQKLRTRCYRSSQTTSCEIKNKLNTGRTKKLRVPIRPDQYNRIFEDAAVVDFIRQNLRFDLDSLLPHVENEFTRITLVNKERTERITIDGDIRFVNHHTGLKADISELVIIEVKQDGHQASPFKKLLHELNIKPKRISKYCLGTLLTNPDVKRNRFKAKIRYINKLITNKINIFQEL